MTTLHDAARMAIDAISDLKGYRDDIDEAIAALREALNAPEPEPYGHVTTHTVTGQQFFYRYPSPPYLDTAKECIAVYAAPPAAPDHLRDIAEKVAPAAPLPDGLATNADEVICPNCAHQFRAIPENVQSLLLASGHEPPFTASPAAPVVPLPRPGPLGLIQYAGVDMLQYAAAVSAAKDKEIAQLRAELIKSLADNAALRADAIDRQNNVVAPLRAEVAGLREDHDALLQFAKHVRRYGDTGIANMAVAVLAARKGEA